jgi:hypothetical protein
MMYILRRLLEKMQGETQSTATADTRKRTYGIDCLSKKFRRIIISI